MTNQAIRQKKTLQTVVKRLAKKGIKTKLEGDNQGNFELIVQDTQSYQVLISQLPFHTDKSIIYQFVWLYHGGFSTRGLCCSKAITSKTKNLINVLVAEVEKRAHKVHKSLVQYQRILDDTKALREDFQEWGYDTLLSSNSYGCTLSLYPMKPSKVRKILEALRAAKIKL